MVKFKQKNKISSIGPSGFTGFIIKSSNVVIDNSFTRKGSSFVNVFDNSNALLKDCGTFSPIVSSTDMQYQKLTYKLKNENNKKLLPFWYHYNLTRDRSSQFLNYIPTNGVRLQPIAVSGSNDNKLMSDYPYYKIDEYRKNLIDTSISQSSDESDNKNYNYVSKLIERQVLNDNINTKDVEYTTYGGYALTSLNSSVKAVFPLNKYQLNLSESPNILLSLKTRGFLPILKDDNDINSKIYLLSGDNGGKYLIKYDKYNLPIKLINKSVLKVDTVDNYFPDLFIHKYIATSKNSTPVFDVDENGKYKNFTLQYLSEPSKYDQSNDNVDIPYFSLEEGIQSGNTSLFFTGPYTVYNVAYKVVNNDGTTSIEPNGNEPLTFYVKVNNETNEVSSLFDLLNTPSGEFVDDEIYTNYFKDNIKEAKDNKKLKFDVKTFEDNEYQPNHMNETRKVGGFYNTSFAVGTVSDTNNISGRLFNSDGNDITENMINTYLNAFAINNSDLRSIDKIDDIKSSTNINDYTEGYENSKVIEIISLSDLISSLNTPGNLSFVSNDDKSEIELQINNQSILSSEIDTSKLITLSSFNINLLSATLTGNVNIDKYISILNNNIIITGSTINSLYFNKPLNENTLNSGLFLKESNFETPFIKFNNDKPVKTQKTINVEISGNFNIKSNEQNNISFPPNSTTWNIHDNVSSFFTKDENSSFGSIKFKIPLEAEAQFFNVSDGSVNLPIKFKNYDQFTYVPIIQGQINDINLSSAYNYIPGCLYQYRSDKNDRYKCILSAGWYDLKDLTADQNSAIISNNTDSSSLYKIYKNENNEFNFKSLSNISVSTVNDDYVTSNMSLLNKTQSKLEKNKIYRLKFNFNFTDKYCYFDYDTLQYVIKDSISNTNENDIKDLKISNNKEIFTCESILSGSHNVTVNKYEKYVISNDTTNNNLELTSSDTITETTPNIYYEKNQVIKIVKRIVKSNSSESSSSSGSSSTGTDSSSTDTDSTSTDTDSTSTDTDSTSTGTDSTSTGTDSSSTGTEPVSYEEVVCGYFYNNTIYDALGNSLNTNASPLPSNSDVSLVMTNNSIEIYILNTNEEEQQTQTTVDIYIQFNFIIVEKTIDLENLTDVVDFIPSSYQTDNDYLLKKDQNNHVFMFYSNVKKFQKYEINDTSNNLVKYIIIKSLLCFFSESQIGDYLANGNIELIKSDLIPILHDIEFDLFNYYDYKALDLSNSESKFNNNELQVISLKKCTLGINESLFSNISNDVIAGKQLFIVNKNPVSDLGDLKDCTPFSIFNHTSQETVNIATNNGNKIKDIVKDEDGKTSGFTLDEFLIKNPNNEFLYVNGDSNKTELYDYKGYRIINSDQIDLNVEFSKISGEWTAPSFNVDSEKYKSDVFQSSFIQLYFDKECTKPFEIVKNEETDSYEINEYSGGTKILVRTIMSDNYASGFEYEKIKTFQWEYSAENYEIEYARDWYNINTYVNSNLFTDISKNNYELNIFKVGEAEGLAVLSGVSDNELGLFFEEKGHFVDDSYNLSTGERNHDSGFGSREISIGDTIIGYSKQNEALASIFRSSDSQMEINSGSDTPNGKFEMNYKLFSFNFKIPERGWSALNDIMYEKNPNYEKNIFDESYPLSTINTDFNSLTKIKNMAYNSILRFKGKLVLYFCVLKSGDFDPGTGFSNYNTAYVEIPWIAGFNKDRTLLSVSSSENASLNFILDFETSSSYMSKKSVINGLHFNCKINGVDHSIQMPAFEVRGRRHFSETNVTDIEIFVRNRFSWDLFFRENFDKDKSNVSGITYFSVPINSNIYNDSDPEYYNSDYKVTSDTYTSIKNNLINSLILDDKLLNKYVRHYQVNIRNANIQLDLSNYTYKLNSDKTLDPILHTGSTDVTSTNRKPFAYSFWEDDNWQGGGAEDFAALYYYQNMGPNLEKNICGYFKTWIPLAGINFVNETVKLDAVNKVKNLHIGYKKYSHKDVDGDKYFTIEYKNPTKEEYVGIKSFNGSRVIIRRDRYATSLYDNMGEGYVTSLDSTNKTWGASISHKFYTSNLNTLYYCRVFYLDSQAGMIYEDPESNADKSCIASGLFLPKPITNTSLTFKLYQLPNNESDWTKASELVPSDSFSLKQMGNNQQWLGNYQFGAELKFNMNVPTDVTNRVKNVAWGALQGYGSTENSFDEHSSIIVNNAKEQPIPVRNIFKCNTFIEYNNFLYNNFGWVFLNHTQNTCIGKTQTAITLNTWTKSLFWKVYSAVEEDKDSTGNITYGGSRPGNWNPLSGINTPHYGTIYPIIENNQPRYIAFEILNESVNGNTPKKPLCYPNYISYNENEPTYMLNSRISLNDANSTILNCMFIHYFIILKRSDYEAHKDALKTDGSKFRIRYNDPHWSNDNNSETWCDANVKFAGNHWDNYVIAQNAVSFMAYYDEHARAHISIINRGTEDYSSKRSEGVITSVPNKWGLISQTLKAKWPNGNNLSTPISGVSANGVSLPSVGEYLKISSSKYDQTLNNQSTWYCRNNQVIQNETITKYKYQAQISSGNVYKYKYKFKRTASSQEITNSEIIKILSDYIDSKPTMAFIRSYLSLAPYSSRENGWYIFSINTATIEKIKKIDYNWWKRYGGFSYMFCKTSNSSSKEWVTDGTITSCDYGNLNHEVRWIVAGYNTFKNQIRKPHMVLISDRPITLPVSAYYSYPGTSFLLKRGKWRDTGCSKYLNNEFLDAFDDGEFKEHIEPVSLDTGKCCHVWVNDLKTTSNNKTSSMVPNDYDVMSQSKNEKVKLFIPSRRNVWSSITMYPGTRKYYTGEVGPEETDRAQVSGTVINYTTLKGVKFTCNGDPYLPIFNVSPSGSTLYTGTEPGGYGFLNKNWYMLDNNKPRGQKGFFLRGSNGVNGIYFIDFDGSVRCDSTLEKTFARTFRCSDSLNHGISLRSKIQDSKAWAAINEYNIVYTYTAELDKWPESATHNENKKITGPAAGIKYASYWNHMHHVGTYWNRTWILRHYNDSTKNMIISLNQLTKLYETFGPVFINAGGSLNKNLLSDPYRNSSSVYYFEQAIDDLGSRWKDWVAAKQNNKDYSNVNKIWKDIEIIISSTYGNAPFNSNNDACKSNKYPVGRRIGILPICIIS